MPFKSRAQQGYMFLTHPRIAKEMAAKTKNWKRLPKHVRRKKGK